MMLLLFYSRISFFSFRSLFLCMTRLSISAFFSFSIRSFSWDKDSVFLRYCRILCLATSFHLRRNSM